jgi:hypothetical protein
MAARPRLQGWVDSMVLLAGGLASALAGVLLQAAGYAAIGAVGLALLVVPVMIMALKGRRAAAALPA